MTVEQLESEIGESLKEARIAQNMPQVELAKRAGITRSSLVNLEAGAGSSLKTFIAVVKALGHESWLKTVAPVGINPFLMVEHRPRLRAKRRAKGSD